MVMRGARRKGVRYFGPYAHAYAIRETLDLLLRTFPVRTCSDTKLERHQKLGRPCLLFHIEKCSGPVRRRDRQGALRRARRRAASSSSRATPTRSSSGSRPQMREAADELEFERAARCRDRLTSVRKAIERQQMVADRNEDLDVIGLADDELEAAVQVFHVRRGRVVGRKGFVLDKVEDVGPDELVGRILLDLYARAAAARRAEAGARAARARGDRRLLRAADRAAGQRRSTIRVPQRGDKRTLQDTVTQNAKEELTRHRLKRASDHNSRAKALNELQEQLGLPEAPLRIECYDMSHLQGTDYVGSMVVFEDGLPKKSEYRRFKLKGVDGNDDFAAMEEVLTRRLTAYLAERRRAGVRARGQVPVPAAAAAGRRRQGPARRGRAGARASSASTRRSPPPRWPSGSRRSSCPGQADPIRLPRQSEALYLLQRIRDESHRFAIDYHRDLRDKRMTTTRSSTASPASARPGASGWSRSSAA